MARLAALPLPQLFDGTTVTFPLFPPTVTVMEFVPCPEVITEPDGTVQVKVMPGTFVTE